MKSSLFKIKCIGCGKHFQQTFMPFCDECNKITDVFYDLESVQLHDSSNPYLRFRELLPVDDYNLLPSTAEYTPVIHAKKTRCQIRFAMALPQE